MLGVCICKKHDNSNQINLSCHISTLLFCVLLIFLFQFSACMFFTYTLHICSSAEGIANHLYLLFVFDLFAFQHFTHRSYASILYFLTGFYRSHVYCSACPVTYPPILIKIYQYYNLIHLHSAKERFICIPLT